jgi:hypothetical protein
MDPALIENPEHAALDEQVRMTGSHSDRHGDPPDMASAVRGSC